MCHGQQWISSLTNSCWHLLSWWWPFLIEWKGTQVNFHFDYLKVRDVDYLKNCVLAICISPFENSPFSLLSIFIQFTIFLFFIFLSCSVFWILISCQVCTCPRFFTLWRMYFLSFILLIYTYYSYFFSTHFTSCSLHPFQSPPSLTIQQSFPPNTPLHLLWACGSPLYIPPCWYIKSLWGYVHPFPLRPDKEDRKSVV